jgi:hypothetical protein
VIQEARGKEDRRVLSAQSIPYKPTAGETSSLLTKEN